MKRWEYKKVSLDEEEDILERKFNRLGEQGWELISIYTIGNSGKDYAMFRREKK